MATRKGSGKQAIANPEDNGTLRASAKLWGYVESARKTGKRIRIDIQQSSSRRLVISVGAAIVVTCVISAGLLAYFMTRDLRSVSSVHSSHGYMHGKPLASLAMYPIVADDAGNLSLDYGLVSAALAELQDPRHPANPKAAVDLLYLIDRNNVERLLSPSDRKLRSALASRYCTDRAASADAHRDHLFSVYRSIVEGIGQTLGDVPIEIVLHDIRNPLQSIVAVSNSITDRHVGGPTTNFGIELIKSYSRGNSSRASYVSYSLPGKAIREIKATTIPLYDSVLGLIGFICINMDVDKLARMARDGENASDLLVTILTRTLVNEQINELIENARTTRRPPPQPVMATVSEESDP